MSKMQNIVRYESIRDDQIEIGDAVVTPLSKTLTVNLPMASFIWKRPLAIEIEKNQEIEHFRIPDVTLMAQLGIFGLGILLSFAYWLISQKNNYSRPT